MLICTRQEPFTDVFSKTTKYPEFMIMIGYDTKMILNRNNYIFLEYIIYNFFAEPFCKIMTEDLSKTLGFISI